jgi:hypothetical protein
MLQIPDSDNAVCGRLLMPDFDSKLRLLAEVSSIILDQE